MGAKSGYRNRLFRAIHAEAKKRKMDHDAIHDMCLTRFGVGMAKLTDMQLMEIYSGWTGHGLRRPAPLPKRGEVGATVLQMATPEDLEMMAAEFAKRGLDEQGRRN